MPVELHRSKRQQKSVIPLKKGGKTKPHMRKPWTRKRILIWSSVGMVAFAIVAYVAFLSAQVFTVKADLERLQLATGTIKQQVKNKDIAGLQQSLVKAKKTTADARHRSEALAWKAAEWVPVLGDNMRAVRVVSTQADSLLMNLALPVVEALPADGQLPHTADGNIDFSFLDTLQPIIESSAGELAAAKKELATVNSQSLLPQISSALRKFQTIADVAAPLPKTMKVLRATLGMDKPITIALVAQNNAEAAVLGGNAASITIMKIEKGQVHIERQISQRDLPLKAVDGSLLTETTDLHGDAMLIWANGATNTPDFPTTAYLLTEHLSRDIGIVPDAFISLDPLALAKFLKVTGPISLDSGEQLTSENAVRLLLNEIYFRFPNADTSSKTDIFFAEAASRLLEVAKKGNFDIWEFSRAFSKSAEEGSLMVWFRDAELQNLISDSPVAGVLPKTNKEATTLGVYFQDNSSSKIDYYLQTKVELKTSTCQPSNSADLEISLHSTLTAEQAKQLPSYVNSGIYGWEYFQTMVFVYAPIGAEITNTDIVKSSRSARLEKFGTDLGRNVAKFVVDLSPGETALISAKISGAHSPAGPWKLKTTPMINGSSSISPPHC